MDKSSRKHKILLSLLGAAIGIAVFLCLYGTSALHVENDAWILNGYDEWDVQQHYAGWLLFRNSHWNFPLGLADTIAAPDGTVISYTDSIPWVSIFLKLLRGILPAAFQWFGWYVLICFALQGAAGALLCGRNTSARSLWQGWAVPLLGALLFCMLPTLWERAFRHTALASQWLILYSLYFYLEYRQSLAESREHFPWQLPLLAFIAVGIHPYFLPPVMVCALLAAAERGRCGGKWGQAAVQFAVSLAAALGGGLLCGAIGGEGGFSRSGYGDFSMNLNALWNPSSRGGYTWSCFLPVLPQQPGQYDGFNYLGLGILTLIAAALVLSAVRAVRAPGAVKDWWRRNFPLAAACAFLTFFALSNKISYGTAGIEIPLPAPLLSLCGIFRASGRMFYLVAACLLLWAVYTLREINRPAAAVLLALFAAVQTADLSAVAAEKRAVFMAPINATVVNNEQTTAIGAGHTQLLAVGDVRDDRLRLLAVLAGKQGLSTNLDIAVSGSHPGAAANRAAQEETLNSGVFDPQAVYVTTDGDVWQGWQQTFADEPSLTFFVADSCYFMVPQP
ncbi:MAG: DUF6311 domain-containing protein [Oscillospiraceae bacterium]|nr:DUF6311 domain-containing protein [Oscillospiraceae bacterium]